MAVYGRAFAVELCLLTSVFLRSLLASAFGDSAYLIELDSLVLWLRWIGAWYCGES